MIGFWHWFFHGNGGLPGIRKYLDRWLILHCLFGTLMALVLPITLQEAGTSLLLPISGIFIGLSFAWGGNAQALLQSPEIESVSEYKDGGYEDYLYTFQSAILLILITLVMWGAAGLGIFDKGWLSCMSPVFYKIVTAILFFLDSVVTR